MIPCVNGRRASITNPRDFANWAGWLDLVRDLGQTIVINGSNRLHDSGLEFELYLNSDTVDDAALNHMSDKLRSILA